MWISWRSIMFETMVAGWVVIISVSLTPYHLYWYVRSLLAHWALCGMLYYHLIIFSITLLIISGPGLGPFGVYACFVRKVSWTFLTYKPIFSSLLPSPYHPVYFILLSLHFHSISCFFFIFVSLCLFSSLGCWFFTYWCKKGSHMTPFIPSFSIDSKILVWEVVSWDGVHVFISDLREFIRSL